MWILLKYIGLSVFKIFDSFYLPVCAGLVFFTLFHDIIDQAVQIRIPFLSKTVMSESVFYFGEFILGVQDLTETKLMLLYLILIAVMAVGTATVFSPIAGIISWGIVCCFLEYLVIKYYVPLEWQTTVFAKFGIYIERIIDFEDLRIIFENLCLTHYCIEPGMNPCKMARDCLDGQQLSGRLMQDMIRHIWDVTEDYHSWAGLAGEYVDQLGPRTTKFTHWYYWYDVWPDPKTLPIPEPEQKLHGEEPFWHNMVLWGLGSAALYTFCILVEAIVNY